MGEEWMESGVEDDPLESEMIRRRFRVASWSFAMGVFGIPGTAYAAMLGWGAVMGRWVLQNDSPSYLGRDVVNNAIMAATGCGLVWLVLSVLAFLAAREMRRGDASLLRGVGAASLVVLVVEGLYAVTILALPFLSSRSGPGSWAVVLVALVWLLVLGVRVAVWVSLLGDAKRATVSL